ncbi:hypothetical protein FNJ87_10520 [Nonlabens mediterrranea]|uniref:Outer membrane protein beta-barrel domain-containing protein n=1 Tax=Nonlabens mediterrranea TaxID=1419947 RepID=A0ABS0A614_9FLAO|nr:hypothetical protein [Nonlabens mediterrranea]
MKRILLTLMCCGLSLIATSQNASVEESTFGIQTGFLGIWAHNESKLSNQIVLRSELGLDTGIFGSDVYDANGHIIVPTITAEPRWYYNLNKRVSKSKRIDGNSGNFISIKTTYHPDWFVISNQDNINFISDISIVPTWGIRRNIGNHFNYETGIGIGYVHYFKEDNVILINESDVAVNLHIRIGYRF